MSNARTIIEDTLVPHKAFEIAKKALEQCYTYAEHASEPICIALIGESRTGKTRVQEECIADHPPIRDSSGLKSSILRVKTPSKPTVKGLAEVVLRALQDPGFNKGTENTMTTRVLTLLKKSETRMVIFDEFQHFYDKGTHKVMFHVADWLKLLADDARVALVVAGLPTCNAVLEQNEQLVGRFLTPVLMPRFDWTNDDHREEFTAILDAFYESMREHFDLPELGTEEMSFRCYCGTGGLVGYLTKFLRQAVWNALDAKTKRIKLTDLEHAHDQSVWKRNGLAGIGRPFAPKFDAAPTPDLLLRVRAIGAPVDPPPKPKGSRSSQPAVIGVQQALSAS
jgi:hypothetical protein